MKRYLLGISLLVCMQTVHAEENQNLFLPTQEVLEHTLSPSAEMTRAFARQDVLASLEHISLASRSAFLLRPDGQVTSRNLVLTVLDAHPEKGVYRISITSSGVQTFTHEFVLGRVGKEYFGQGTEDRVFGILLKKVGRNLELSYSVRLSSDNTNSQVRAIFSLPRG